MNEDIQNIIQELEKAEIEQEDEVKVEEVEPTIDGVKLIYEEKTENDQIENQSNSSEEVDVEENNYPETNFRFQILKDDK